MNGAAWLLTVATLGVDFGWQVNEQGKLEYIVQFDEAQLEQLRQRPEGITSFIPPEIQGVRYFRIRVGTEPPPREPLENLRDRLGNSTPLNMREMDPIAVGSTRLSDNPARIAPVGNEVDDIGIPLVTESPVPFEGAGLRADLPGPVDDVEGPRGSVDDLIGATVPRRSLPSADLNGESTVKIGAGISLRSLDHGPRPNTSSPEIPGGGFTNQQQPPGSYATNSTVPLQNNNGGFSDWLHQTPPKSNFENRQNNPAAFNNNGYSPNGYQQNGYLPNGNLRERPWEWLAFTLCLLFLSIGFNIFIAWIAWGYYLRYRETIDQWRSASLSSH